MVLRGVRGAEISKRKKKKKDRNDSLVSSCCSHKTMYRKNGGVSKGVHWHYYSLRSTITSMVYRKRNNKSCNGSR